MEVYLDERIEMTQKKSKKKQKVSYRKYLVSILVILIALLGGTGVSIFINNNGEVHIDTSVVAPNYVLSEEQVPATMEDDLGEIVETTEYEGEEIKTVEEVDGGLFEDATTGLSTVEGDYDDLGWSETYNVSSPEAFRNDTIGKCIIANNRYGAQCVSLARVFWWSYANRDVSTCGTGMAKGMMKCADQNAGNDFVVYWKDSASKIQAGDWLVFDGGQFGHVGMALGSVNNGYVTLLGENQGGHSCGQGVGGAATNIINISVKNLIGFYRPKAYIKPEPKPTPTPSTETYKVKKGDTLGGIARKLGWYTGKKLYGDDGYAQALAEYNGIKNRGLIYPNQIIKRK